MTRSPLPTHDKIFSTCRRTLGSTAWGRVLAAMEADATPERFADRLASLTDSMDLPGYLTDLARLEWLLFKIKTADDDPGRQEPGITVNPTLTILPVRWKNLPEFVRSTATDVTLENEPAHVLVWRHPKSGVLNYRDADAIDLLALKLVVEQIDPIKAAQMGLKGNLINIIRREKDQAPFGGCTGHGCGAAFNFLALLPDGEVHACRKFPSLIGNILENDIYDIYHGQRAQRYRAGSQACRNCGLNVVCRSCLAIAYSLGLDIFTNRDPFCFAPRSITGE